MRLERVLASWRDSLIDLSPRNRLVDYQRRVSSAGMDVVAPGIASLVEALPRGCGFAPVPEDGSEGVNAAAPDAASAAVVPAGGSRPLDTPASRSGVGRGRPAVLLTTSKDSQDRQDRHVARLAVVAREKYNDYGLSVLHLGVGFLDWKPVPAAERSFASPLVLVPVVLERRGRDVYVLKENPAEEAMVNPALGLKMAEFDIDWPQVDHVKTADIAQLIGDVRRAVAKKPGWAVTDRVVLDVFNSSKEVMYRDLLENADTVLAHPLVRAIGLGADGRTSDRGFDFEPVDVDRIDAVQPPETAPLVMDADSSQRQCVAAAIDGRSFVMDGPPGTGKSQTITNMIAGLLEQGRTVLFVSEKAAALDVVRNRLASVGLDDYVLALHSNNTGRKQVAQEFGRALTAGAKKPRSDKGSEARRARALREELSGYAAAMNEVDDVLGMSLHDVLGRIALLKTTHALPADTAFDAARLTADMLVRISDAAHQAARAWEPAVLGPDFPWYGLLDTGNPLQALDIVFEAGTELKDGLGPYAPLLAELGWETWADAARLPALLHTAADRPAMPVSWLSRNRRELHGDVERFRARLGRLTDATRQAKKAVGSAWERLPAELDPVPGPAEAALAALDPPAVDVSSQTADAAGALAERLAADAAVLDEAVTSLAAVAGAYGLPAPETFDDAVRLGRVAAAAALPDEAKPPGSWLTTAAAAEAAAAVRALREAVAELVAARDKAAGTFTDQVLREDTLDDVARRFATVHRSFVKRMSASCRADKRLVGSLLPDGAKCTKSVIAALPLAVAWRQASRALDTAVLGHAGALGTYWHGEATDFAVLEALAARAASIAADTPVVRNRDALLREVATGGASRPAASEAVGLAVEALTAWRGRLVPPSRPGPSYALETQGLRNAAAWSRAHVEPLRDAEELVRTVHKVAAEGAADARGPWTVAEARAAVGAVRAARAAGTDFASDEAADLTLLGEMYRGPQTDVSRLDAAFAWLDALRADCRPKGAASIGPKAAEMLYGASADAALDRAVRDWRRDTEALAGMFRPEVSAQVRATLGGTPDQAWALLRHLGDHRDGPDVWRAYSAGRRVLDDVGLGDLVDRSVRRGIDAEDFPGIVERAALRAWADLQLATDARLATTRAADRDHQVAEFRLLDAELARHAQTRVVHACNRRRADAMSATDVRAAAFAMLRRQSELKGRHKPVRDLIQDGGDAVRVLKPCFMMSPLSVSRFLPPDVVFDVVIFDEASQVLPEDAVNCVYRGRSLIVAGDQKQLPPTSFFSAVSDGDSDDEDDETPEQFQSVLDLCKASGLLPSLSLRWHYRSRHEALIAFSNREFYGESMTTFPGAHAEGDDVGVSFHRAEEGVYRAGAAARDNPGEAAEVARRVIHHFSTRTGKSLGVVALSQSQALAIQDAVDAARRARPDLDACFSEDRLDGFFIKNLESVQGDERDVMIMSVGYGPTAEGKFSRNFGPINRHDGWRRLNVAVTRARYRVEVVASFDPDTVSETPSKGQRYFLRYLRYAQHGPAVLSREDSTTASFPESPFEESVLDVLQGWGYDVEPQVGVSGYRIDLGVRRTDRPGVYALGIECDGAMYHSSKAARDRDRLREGVLRGLGWELHRIWGTDWYRNRAAAEQRLREAVERAMSAPVMAGPPPRAAEPERKRPEQDEAPRQAAPRNQETPARNEAVPDQPSRANPRPAADGRPYSPPTSVVAAASLARIDNELAQISAYFAQPADAEAGADLRARTDLRRQQESLRTQLEERAAFLRAFRDAARVVSGTAPHAWVTPGRLVGLVLEGESGVEEFEITERRPSATGVEPLRPSSTLGEKLLWCEAGTKVEYADDAGRRRTVFIRHVRD